MITCKCKELKDFQKIVCNSNRDYVIRIIFDVSKSVISVVSLFVAHGMSLMAICTKATRFVGNVKPRKALNLFGNTNLLRMTWLNKNEEFKEHQCRNYRIGAANRPSQRTQAPKTVYSWGLIIPKFPIKFDNEYLKLGVSTCLVFLSAIWRILDESFTSFPTLKFKLYILS